jgi:predicted  nucleic acid-binding Zn-ribbon protein
MLERVFDEGKGIRPGHSLAWHDRFMVDWARARREVIRKQAELRRRLTAAERALDDAQAQVRQAEAAFDAASDRFVAAESALDVARAERAR